MYGFQPGGGLSPGLPGIKFQGLSPPEIQDITAEGSNWSLILRAKKVLCGGSTSANKTLYHTDSWPEEHYIGYEALKKPRLPGPLALTVTRFLSEGNQNSNFPPAEGYCTDYHEHLSQYGSL